LNAYGLDNIGFMTVSYQPSRVNTRYYYLKDHLGSIKMTVNSGGAVTSYDDYYPFGMLKEGRSGNFAQSDARFKFTGKERDVESGYDYFGTRYLASTPARFFSIDRRAMKYPQWSPYVYAADNPTIFMDPNGDSINVAGSRQSEFSNLVSQRTGVLFGQTSSGDLIVIPGPINSSSVSSDLADLVVQLVSSENIVTINTMGQSDQVFFDVDAREAKPGYANSLDMGDVSAISNYPELQSAFLGHLLTERSTPGSLTDAHNAALKFETQVMQRLSTEPVRVRTSPFFDRTSNSFHQARGPVNGLLYFNAFDYGTRAYYISSQDASPFNPNNVFGVTRVIR